MWFITFISFDHSRSGPRPWPKETVRSRTKKGEIEQSRQQEYPNFFDFSLLLLVCIAFIICYAGLPFLSRMPLTDYPRIFFSSSRCEAFDLSSWNYVLFSCTRTRSLCLAWRKYLFSLSAVINYIGWKKTKVLIRTLTQEKFFLHLHLPGRRLFRVWIALAGSIGWSSSELWVGNLCISRALSRSIQNVGERDTRAYHHLFTEKPPNYLWMGREPFDFSTRIRWIVSRFWCVWFGRYRETSNGLWLNSRQLCGER